MTTSAGIILLVGRVLFAVFFLNSAYGHFKNHKMMTGFAKQSGIPVPVVAGWPSGAWLAARSISDQSAPNASPVRAAVKIRNSRARGAEVVVSTLRSLARNAAMSA